MKSNLKKRIRIHTHTHAQVTINYFFIQFYFSLFEILSNYCQCFLINSLHIHTLLKKLLKTFLRIKIIRAILSCFLKKYFCFNFYLYFKTWKFYSISFFIFFFFFSFKKTSDNNSKVFLKILLGIYVTDVQTQPLIVIRWSVERWQ